MYHGTTKTWGVSWLLLAFPETGDQTPWQGTTGGLGADWQVTEQGRSLEVLDAR